MRPFTVLALVAIVGCSDSSKQSVDPRIADASRPLVFLTQPTEPPCSYTNAAGEIVGTDVELARRIAAKMGRALVVEGAEFTEILPRLKSGTADFGIASITITEARSKDVDFSAPYKMDGGCFLYRKDGPRPRMSQSTSLRVGAKLDSVHDLYLSIHGCAPLRFESLADAVEALGRNEIDALFFDAAPLRELAAKSGGRLVVSPLETREGYGVAVDKRRPDVLAAANAVIAEGGAK